MRRPGAEQPAQRRRPRRPWQREAASPRRLHRQARWHPGRSPQARRRRAGGDRLRNSARTCQLPSPIHRMQEPRGLAGRATRAELDSGRRQTTRRHHDRGNLPAVASDRFAWAKSWAERCQRAATGRVRLRAVTQPVRPRVGGPTTRSRRWQRQVRRGRCLRGGASGRCPAPKRARSRRRRRRLRRSRLRGLSAGARPRDSGGTVAAQLTERT